jgi:hypothetical protein
MVAPRLGLYLEINSTTFIRPLDEDYLKNLVWSGVASSFVSMLSFEISRGRLLFTQTLLMLIHAHVSKAMALLGALVFLCSHLCRPHSGRLRLCFGQVSFIHHVLGQHLNTWRGWVSIVNISKSISYLFFIAALRI